MFTDRLREECRRLGLPAIELDVGISRGEAAELVSAALGLN